MAAVSNGNDFTINRAYYFSIRGNYCNSITENFFGKDRIRNLIQGNCVSCER